MSGDEGIRRALVRVQETREASRLPQGMKTLIAAGQKLVGIRLMPHIKNDAVFFRVIDPVQGYGEFHSPEIGGKMSPVFGDRIDNDLSVFLRHAMEKYRDRIAACILACGATDEWYDYSSGTESSDRRAAWRAWQTAHGRPDPT